MSWHFVKRTTIADHQNSVTLADCLPYAIAARFYLSRMIYCSGQVNWNGQLSASSVLSHRIAVLSVSAGRCPKVRDMSVFYFHSGIMETFSVSLQKTRYRLFRNTARRSSTNYNSNLLLLTLLPTLFLSFPLNPFYQLRENRRFSYFELLYLHNVIQVIGAGEKSNRRDMRTEKVIEKLLWPSRKAVGYSGGLFLLIGGEH